MWFRVLGPLEVSGAARQVAVVAKRQQIILMMVLLEANQNVSVERLIEAVWDDEPPATAKSQVQICVSLLRRLIADLGLPEVITTAPGGYRARVPEDQLDLTVFERLVRDARRAVAEDRPADADDLFGRAVALWRGRTLTTGESRVVAAAALRVGQEWVSAVTQWTDVRLRLGQHYGLVGDLTELVATHPLHEGLRARLMHVLHRSGRQAEALEVYRTGRRLLVEELGIEPGEELRAAEMAILNAPPETPPSPSSPGPSPAPAPPEPSPPVVLSTRMLPSDIADFTGHAANVRLLGDHLLSAREGRAGGVPVVVISGKAGVGKTTLAVHVCHALAGEFPDGQLFVKLDGLSSQPVTATQTLERFLRSLGVSGSAMPERLEERADMYRQLVAGRRMIVMLDDAVDEEQVRPLIPGTPTCAVVVTSRFRLTGVPGAAAVNLGLLGSNEAIEMMAKVVGADRMYGELGDAQRLAEICGRLPFALRIAAARLASHPHWSVGEFVERIVDESARLDELEHHGVGVRPNLALTYQILGEPARRLFRRLGVLEVNSVAGWCAAPLLGVGLKEAQDALDVLVVTQFIDVESTGDPTRVRYGLHDLIRTYARDRLVHDEVPQERVASLRRALGGWLFLAERAHRKVYGADDTVVHGSAERWVVPERVVERELRDPLKWYESERYGLMSAIRQAAGSGQDELCWDLALTSVTLFEATGFYDDWRISHEIALAETRRARNRRGEAAILHSLGALRLYEQEFEEAAERMLAAERIFLEVGDDHGRGLVLRNLAFLDRTQGRVGSAERRCEAALLLLRAAGDQVGEAHVLSSLAQIELERGDYPAADRHLADALVLAERVGNRRLRSQMLYRRGEVQLGRGDDAAAERTFREVIAATAEYADQVGEVYARYGLGTALIRLGRTEEAEEHLLEAEERAGGLDHQLLGGQIRMALGQIRLDRGPAEAAMEFFVRALHAFAELGMGAWRARALLAIGDTHLREGRPEAAENAWREGLALAGALEPAAAGSVPDELRSRLG